jgi:hypothetical protein
VAGVPIHKNTSLISTPRTFLTLCMLVLFMVSLGVLAAPAQGSTSTSTSTSTADHVPQTKRAGQAKKAKKAKTVRKARKARAARKARKVRMQVKQARFGTWFINHVGTTRIKGQPVKGYCLRNVDLVAGMHGFPSRTYRTASEKGLATRRAGKMNTGKPGSAPLGALYWWKKTSMAPYGHVAVSDGKGNYINNIRSALRVKSFRISGYLGWSDPKALRK